MKQYKTYFFRGQDPMLTEAISRIMETGKSVRQLSQGSGVAPSTYYNWKRRKSKRTFASTLNAALRGAGMSLEIVEATTQQRAGKKPVQHQRRHDASGVRARAL